MGLPYVLGLILSEMVPYLAAYVVASRTLPAGFIEPCLPTSTKRPPSRAGWLHEIKHDGFRVIARKDGTRVRLCSRPGNVLTKRFPRVTEAVARLRARSCILDARRSFAARTGSPASISSGIGETTRGCSGERST
jgi:hypothetical protein